MVGESSIRLDSRTQRVLRAASPSRVGVDETASKINGDRSWIYSAIYLDTKLILDVALFRWRGTELTAVFLHRFAEKHDLAEAEFLVDGAGYLTALSRVGLSDHPDYVDRTHIEEWFHTLTMRIDRFHSSWVDSRESTKERIE